MKPSSLTDPLLFSGLRAKESPTSEEKMAEHFQAQLKMVGVAAFCIAMGVLHPLVAEMSKTAELVVCDDFGDCLPTGSGRRTMPFHAVTLTLVAELVSVVTAFGVVWHMKGSAKVALDVLLERRAMLQLLPVGAVYGIGDFLQTCACNASSSAVVLVVGQSKLILSALLSKMLFVQKRPTNWLRLLTISCAAAASTSISAEHASIRSLELYGASLALCKAFLSSSGAVLSEALYKCSEDGFWIVSFRIQLIMFITSLCLFPVTSGNSSLGLSDFFLGGPEELCPCMVLEGQQSCICVDRKGWDSRTVLAVLAIVANGLTTGLTLKTLSAVSKAVCNSLSAGCFYVAYTIAGFRAFSLAQANVILIVTIASFEYAVERAETVPALVSAVGKCPQRRQVRADDKFAKECP